MTDLTAIAGFPVTLAGLRLTFHEPVTSARLAIRKSSDQRQFWRDDPPEAEEDRELLAAYWGIARAEDEEAFRAKGLEHVYALMLPGFCGREFLKTPGHYHAPVAPSGMATPEIYQVLTGRGLFLLQRSEHPCDVVDDVIAVEAAAGELVVVPPDYGHMTANLGNEVLVFEAFLIAGVQPLAEPYAQRRGGAYYCVASGDGTPKLIPNNRYDRLPPARRLEPLRWPVPPRGAEQRAFYRSFVSRMDDYGWITDPAKYDPARIADVLRPSGRD